ncbi:MAG TPA: DUF2851 family protein [Chloroflexia bacterium]|nr:DUF2851 family protein [Chloroflexia bacterium]
MCLPTSTQPDQILSPTREINEAVLAAVWNEQAPLRGPMWDCEGNPVAVVYRGRWTAGSGPDFEGAMLSLGEKGRLVSGSVEMHLKCADWWAHGHHADPNYNTVALHVVLWQQGVRPVTRADGVQVPTLVLADYITLPAGELLDKVAPLVPRLGTLSEEPCWQRTEGWPLEQILAEIEQAGDERLLSKAALMDAELEMCGSPDEVFYRGLMDALGYSANREPMRALAAALPLNQLLTLPLGKNEAERTALLEAVLLGAGGFLPSQRQDLGEMDWLSAQYAEEAERLWTAYSPGLGIDVEGPLVSGWEANRVRPANSPPRRLAAAARLLARLLWHEGGMLGPFLGLSSTATPASVAKKWIDTLTVRAEGYWASHADFCRDLAREGQEDIALIGSSRASDIIVNILFPLLVAHADRNHVADLRERCLAAYAEFPRLAENKITRAMADEALGPRKKGVITGARRQQGLIHLYRLYCEARRCYECPVSGLRGAGTLPNPDRRNLPTP